MKKKLIWRGGSAYFFSLIQNITGLFAFPRYGARKYSIKLRKESLALQRRFNFITLDPDVAITYLDLVLKFLPVGRSGQSHDFVTILYIIMTANSRFRNDSVRLFYAK